MPEYHLVQDILKPYKLRGLRHLAINTQKQNLSTIETYGESRFRGYWVSDNPAGVTGKKLFDGEALDQYIDYLKLLHLKPATIKRHLAVYSSAIKWCRKKKHMRLPNPFADGIAPEDQREIKPRSRIIAEDEEIRLLSVSSRQNPLMHDLIIFFLETGFRRSEALRLTWDRVKGDYVWFSGDDQKSGTAGWGFLPPKALEVIGRQPKVSPYVFTLNGNRYVESTFGNHWRKLCKAAWIDDLIPHDLRRTCGYRCNNRFGIEVTQHLLRHQENRTTQIVYARSNAEKVKTAYNQM